MKRLRYEAQKQIELRCAFVFLRAAGFPDVLAKRIEETLDTLLYIHRLGSSTKTLLRSEACIFAAIRMACLRGAIVKPTFKYDWPRDAPE